MKYRLIFCLLGLFIFNITVVFGQNGYKKKNFVFDLEPQIIAPFSSYYFDVVSVDISKDRPHLNVVVSIEAINQNNILEDLSIRFSNDGNDWSPYQQIKKDYHLPGIHFETQSDLIFADASTRFLQLKFVNHQNINIGISKVELILSSPSQTYVVEKYNHMNEREPCPLPGFQSRDDWCPSGACDFPEGTWTDVTHLIVHHSAGVSTSSNWPSVIESIWNYHVVNKGWDDIGYNWLIDPEGIIYQGRLDDIRGAHMCAKNSGTMGICLLGNFEDVDPTEQAINSLISLLAWKSNQKDLNPLATTYHASSGKQLKTIAGHKDGCPPNYTLCPGTNFYPLFPDMRVSVDDYLNDCQASFLDSKQLIGAKLINNLASDYLRIENKQHINFYYKVSNIVGQTIIPNIQINDDLIDIRTLTTGFYLLYMASDSGVSVTKFNKI